MLRKLIPCYICIYMISRLADHLKLEGFQVGWETLEVGARTDTQNDQRGLYPRAGITGDALGVLLYGVRWCCSSLERKAKSARTCA